MKLIRHYCFIQINNYTVYPISLVIFLSYMSDLSSDIFLLSKENLSEIPYSENFVDDKLSSFLFLFLKLENMLNLFSFLKEDSFKT